MSNAKRESKRARDDPKSVGSFERLKRQRLFETGTESSEEPGSQVLDRLREITNRKIITKKGSYRYKNLESEDEIRVLRILRGKHGSPVQCTLIPTCLPFSGPKPSNSKAETIEYEALSYWWGDSEVTKKILIWRYHDPKSASGMMLEVPPFETFYVRPNLYEALQRLRDPEQDIDIWVDAICINQNNLDERTAQVSRMHEIYSEATKVCIWLGAGTGETKDTFALLKEILDLRHLDSLIYSKKKISNWCLIDRLMRVRWFSRRWVIQELALAKKATICWGSEEMLWVDFSEAIALFMTKHDEIQRILCKDPKYTKSKEEFGDLRPFGANELVNATSDLFRKTDDGKIQRRLVSLEMLVSCKFASIRSVGGKGYHLRCALYRRRHIGRSLSIQPSS
jgi:hypothetical protein